MPKTPYPQPVDQKKAYSSQTACDTKARTMDKQAPRSLANSDDPLHASDMLEDGPPGWRVHPSSDDRQDTAPVYRSLSVGHTPAQPAYRSLAYAQTAAYAHNNDRPITLHTAPQTGVFLANATTHNYDQVFDAQANKRTQLLQARAKQVKECVGRNVATARTQSLSVAASAPHSYTRNSPHITDAQAKAQTQKQPICNDAQTMHTPKASRLATSTDETTSQATHDTRQTTSTTADFETRNHRQPNSVRSSKKPSLWQRFAWIFYPFQCVFSYANHARIRVSLLALSMLLASHATIRRFLDASYYAMHRLPWYKRIQKQLSGKIMQRIRLVLLQTLLHVSILSDHSITLIMIKWITGSKYAKHMLRCMLYPLRHVAAYRTLLMFLIPNVRIFCLFLQITITLFAINSVRNIHAHTWHVSLFRYYKAHGFWPSVIDFISKIAHSAWIFAVVSSASTGVSVAIFGTCMIYGYARWLFTQKEVYVSFSAFTPEPAKCFPLHEATPRVNLPRGYFIMKKQSLDPEPPQKSASVQKKLALYGLCQDFERHVSATHKHRYGVDLPMDGISLFLPICYAIQRNETNQSDTRLHGDFYELQRLTPSTEQGNNTQQPQKTKSNASKNTTLLVDHSLNQRVSKLMHELWPIWYGKNAHVLHQLGIKRMKYPRAQDMIGQALRII